MINKIDVNIRDVPVPTNVETAKVDLAEKVTELRPRRKSRSRSFEVSVEVNPEYHSKIIVRSGEVIKKLREDFGVKIQLPEKVTENSEIITITGLEADGFDQMPMQPRKPSFPEHGPGGSNY